MKLPFPIYSVSIDDYKGNYCYNFSYHLFLRGILKYYKCQGYYVDKKNSYDGYIVLKCPGIKGHIFITRLEIHL